MNPIKLLILCCLCLVGCRKAGEIVGSASAEFADGLTEKVKPITERQVQRIQDQAAERERQRKLADPKYNPYWDASKGRRMD